jgi:hypothetical protein
MKDLGGVRVTPEVPQLPPDEQLPLAPCGPHLEQYKQLMTVGGHGDVNVHCGRTA